jgi:hypothetical protein
MAERGASDRAGAPAVAPAVAGAGQPTPSVIGVTAPLGPTPAAGAVAATGLEARAAVGGEGAGLGVAATWAVGDVVGFGATIGATVVAVGV